MPEINDIKIIPGARLVLLTELLVSFYLSSLSSLF